MNRYLNKLNRTELEKHVNRLKADAANDVRKLPEGNYQRRFAELLVDTDPEIKDPDIDLEKYRLEKDDPAAALQIANGFGQYVKNAFVENTIWKEINTVNQGISVIEQNLAIKRDIAKQHQASRNWFQRHFNVFRSRADKANAFDLARSENNLKYEQKYKNLLTITQQKVSDSIEEFENTNKDKLDKINQRVDELRIQRLNSPLAEGWSIPTTPKQTTPAIQFIPFTASEIPAPGQVPYFTAIPQVIPQVNTQK